MRRTLQRWRMLRSAGAGLPSSSSPSWVPALFRDRNWASPPLLSLCAVCAALALVITSCGSASPTATVGKTKHKGHGTVARRSKEFRIVSLSAGTLLADPLNGSGQQSYSISLPIRFAGNLVSGGSWLWPGEKIRTVGTSGAVRTLVIVANAVGVVISYGGGHMVLRLHRGKTEQLVVAAHLLVAGTSGTPTPGQTLSVLERPAGVVVAVAVAVKPSTGLGKGG